MTQFKVMKTILKNALALSKRALPKKDGKTILVSNGKELMVFTRGQGLEVFDYIPLIEATEEFYIEFDPAPVDKWLDGGNRELVFEIREKKLKEEIKFLLYSEEKKKSVDVKFTLNPEKSFLEVRNHTYHDFINQDLIIKSWYEANNTFQNSERIYAGYAKVTDINFMVFDPLFFSAYFYQEEFGIINKYGQDGIAVPKEAIDTFVKTIKKPKHLKHHLSDKRFLIREENTIFSMEYSNEIKFPLPQSLKILNDDKRPFLINSDLVKEALKSFPNNKVSKLRFVFNGEMLTIQTENPDFEDIQIPCIYKTPTSTFTPSAIKAFFEGLTGNVEVTYSEFNSKTTKKGYYWKYQDLEKAKIVPGIKEAPGF